MWGLAVRALSYWTVSTGQRDITVLALKIGNFSDSLPKYSRLLLQFILWFSIEFISKFGYRQRPESLVFKKVV